MILSKTPLRVSFVGGGTDLPAFYERNDYGCVISAAVNRYVYVAVNHRFDGMIRLAYSTNELVSSLEEIHNERIRETLRIVGIRGGIEVFYISDVPKKMGLGGSSSFTVGLLNALLRHKGDTAFPERLAREAGDIEMRVLGNAIGKQDHYAAAIGGLNYIKFWADGTVTAEPLLIDESLILAIMDSLLFIYLGVSHVSTDILTHVNSRMDEASPHLRRIRDIADQLHLELLRRNVDQFPMALRENWELKKRTSHLISNGDIDDLYDRCLAAGASAGKLLGAGGGGFLMLFVPPERQDHFMARMGDLRIFKFAIEHSGSQIVHDDHLAVHP